MIFSTQNQFNSFLIFIFVGLVFGLIFQILNLIFLKNYQKIFLKIIFDTVFFTFFSIFLVFLLNIFNFGKFSYTLCLATVLGFFTTKKLCKNLVALFETKWYNFIKSKFKGKGNGKKSKFRKS